MIDTWNPAVLNETTQAIDSWNPAEINRATTKVDSWNPAILNKNLESSEPVVFSATITASFPEGSTCTATDGTTTLTADDNPMAFSIPNEGTWAVACVANGVTFSEDVVITTNGQTETIDLTPVGDTYATTDSVPVLIACAGIGDSEITTIAGALADVETLTAILESENAIDYLVRSTTFASDVTADSVAMTGIGAINYDANALLGNSTWRAAICDSTYFESVLNIKIPVMTSNTTPSGEATAISEYSSNYAAYKVFDDNISTYWSVSGGTFAIGDWVKYMFTDPVMAFKVVASFGTLGNKGYGSVLIIDASNDNTDWNTLTTLTYDTVDNNTEIASFDNSVAYQYYRLIFTTVGSIGDGVASFQIYGRVDV